MMWPKVTSETKPWTRWWWLGPAVDKNTITSLLREYSKVGLGGVEITSIYGVKGEESKNIEYLSPKWVEMIEHTIAEADKLSMKVDLPPGSGWRIGGPFITEDLGASRILIEIDE